MDASEALLGARRIFASANGLTFEVFEAGQGERLALLLHGFPETAVMWRHLVAAAAAGAVGLHQYSPSALLRRP